LKPCGGCDYAMKTDVTITDERMVLTCTGVTKTYRTRGKQISVLRGIDLAIPKGTLTVITGNSGTGKTTLLSIAGGLDRPDTGRIAFMGNPMESLTARESALLRRGRIGFIFQNFNLIDSWTAIENAEAGLIHLRVTADEKRRLATDLLAGLGLAGRLDSFPDELSVGEEQRVAIARTLAARPSLVLADEPTGSVDDETGAEIIRRLMAHTREHGGSVIVATHGPFPLGTADAVFRLAEGVLLPL